MVSHQFMFMIDLIFILKESVGCSVKLIFSVKREFV